MAIQVTGKNIDTGESFQSYVMEKARSVMEKYIGPEISGHIRVEKERGSFHTNCSMRLKTGLLLEAQGSGPDAFASADAALERLEKRIRRYKRRLKDHHHGNNDQVAVTFSATDHIVQADDEAIEKTEEKSDPLIVAEATRDIPNCTVSQAVMRLDLTEQPFLVFRNAGTDQVNIVYRRDDGHVGWINP